MAALARRILGAVAAPAVAAAFGIAACGGSVARATAGTADAASAPTVIAIAAGDAQTCARLSNGTVACWGDNIYGELGDGESTGPHACSGYPCSTSPVTVEGASGVMAITAGVHACALLEGGTIRCWGDNTFGELGVGTSTGPETCNGYACSTTPVAVSGLQSSATAIAAGGAHACAIAGGVVECWGDNAFGELGVATSAGPETCLQGFGCSTMPVPIAGLLGVTALAAGAEHTCALMSDATVACWGDNTFGELGSGAMSGPESCRGGNPTGAIEGGGCSTTPVPVPGLSRVSAIAAAGWETCALLSDGTVECWGYDEYGELGDANNPSVGECGGGARCATAPVPVSGVSGVTALAVGGMWQTCALLSGGTVQCWGENAYGEIGNGTSTGPTACSGYPCITAPVEVSGLSGVTAIAAGAEHTCALLSDGAVECWGDDTYGELGNGLGAGPDTCNGSACATTPVPVSALEVRP